jgi:hypothetical protein
MDIKETIESTPELLALMPDARAIAEFMSINRTKLGTVSRAWLATWSAGNGMRAVIQDTANTEGHPLRSIALATLDVLSGAADGIDFSVPANVASVQAWVAVGLMPQSEADALFALGTYPDPVSERDVVLAITNDDGSAKL